MTSHRPYRQGMHRDTALGILSREEKAQFDARFAEIFVALSETELLDHIIGHSDGGIPLQSCPMCGPTLVLRKGQHAEERIYCRNYSGEFALKKVAGCLIATPTGNQGRPEDLAPEPDTDLIRRTVMAAVEMLPARDLLEAPAAASRSP